ncbi:MAG: heavy metal translocating P-type ATPase [Candidatus Parvibacillus calidus]|nr:MAG: heavy metal translocating P-type ATPase [Candidatus Parvibacillus calidus]
MMKLLNILILNLIALATMVAQTPVQIKVDGMTCDFCVNSVTKKLSNAKEIENITVDLEKGLVHFNVKKGSKVDKKKYMELVEKAGYDAREIKVGNEIKATQNAKAKQVNYVPASHETTTFKVGGECGMCKQRIESNVRAIKGVKSASWNKETKVLTVTYNPMKIDIMDVHKKIASVGRDTELVKADDAVYDKLPNCCHYDRLK